MSAKDNPAAVPSDDEDDAENIEIDMTNSIWELDISYEYDAPQWFDFTNVDEVFISDDAAGGDHSWFMSSKPGHEPVKAFWMPSTTTLASAPTSPRTPGKSRIGPLGISHLGSPMRVVTLPQSPVAASSPRSPNIRTPTSSPKAPAPVSRFIQQAAASPKVAQSPQRALLGSPARVASPIQQESSPSSIQMEPRGRNLIKSFSVTFMNAMAAKEAKMSSPATAGSAGPTSTAAVPTVGPSMIPTPSLEDLQLNLSDTEDYLGSNPASPSDENSDGDDSFPSPPPVPSTILTSFLMRSTSISPSNTQSEAPMAASPALQPTEASNLGPLGRLGAPMRVQKAEPVAEIAEAVDDEFEEPPAPKLSSLAMTRPVIQKSSSMASRTAISAKNPIKIAGKPPAASSMAPAVSSKAPSNPRGVPTLEKPTPKASAPIPAVSNSSAKQKPAALGQAARKPPAPVLPPQPPQQPSTITKRKAKVIYTPASSAAQEENLENLADPWLSQPKPTAPARKFGKLGVEVDESMIQMVREHNKKFAPKPAYEPRKFSLHEIRAWERQSGQQWYNLSPQSRERANEQIAAMQTAASQL